MKKNFSAKTRELFDMGGYCKSFETGKNSADCLHHVLGRVSNSPYNACPLNNKDDHQPEGRKNLPALSSDEVIRKYLNKIKRYLDSVGYEPTDADKDFLERNKKYYD